MHTQACGELVTCKLTLIHYFSTPMRKAFGIVQPKWNKVKNTQEDHVKMASLVG